MQPGMKAVVAVLVVALIAVIGLIVISQGEQRAEACTHGDRDAGNHRSAGTGAGSHRRIGAGR